jgi:hypothetical protein
MRCTYRAGLAATLVALAIAVLLPGSASAAQTAPCPTTPTYDPAVPTPQSVLGFPLGIGQPAPVTSGDIFRYMQAVDAATDRVRTLDIGSSWGGHPLKVAIVSSRKHMRPHELRLIRSVHQALRAGHLNELGPKLARSLPAIVWLAGNVHGGEKSGADAELQILYELASRTDCEVRDVNEDVVTLIMPTQNPDGRDASRRQNNYGFDMNRDWFARTQPETDAKVELLRRYPGQVFVDAHEMGGRRYFFPPNADPIHHEIADEPVDWINRIGERNKTAFGYNGACTDTVTTECYFNYDVYDLFFMGYGDTAPAAGFGAAGMTYEKGSASPTELRVDQQLRTQWSTVKWASENRREIVEEWAGIWSQAEEEGEDGFLQPNEVVQPDNTVQFPVPDIRIRHYFLPAGRAQGDARKLVQRLRRMDVHVYRLRDDLTIPSARIFGGRSASGYRVPEGSYWIPMAQPQKHWIQATLGEDPYVPFPYFYDASTWSNPLLMGIDTVYTGDTLKPKAHRVLGPEGGVDRAGRWTRSYAYPLDSSRAAGLTFRLLAQGVPLRRDTATNTVSLAPGDAPDGLDELATSYGIDLEPSSAAPAGTPLERRALGVFGTNAPLPAAGSFGEIKYVVEQNWGESVPTVTAADVNGNTAAFTSRDVLFMPDGGGSTGGLDAAGFQNLRDWVTAGGTYIGFRNLGTRLARSAGLTTTTEKAKPTDGSYLVLGSHFRVLTDHASPVALGRPAEDFVFNNNDPLLNPTTTGVNVLSYPSDARFWFNGYAQGADLVRGTVALTDEPYGAGHVVLFANNPLFRAYEESGEHLVANAVLYPGGGAAVRTMQRATEDTSAADAAVAAATAQDEAPNLGGQWRPITIEVAEAQLGAALAVVRGYAEPASVGRTDGSAYIVIANPDGLQADEHPFARDLLQALRSDGVEIRAAVL